MIPAVSAGGEVKAGLGVWGNSGKKTSINEQKARKKLFGYIASPNKLKSHVLGLGCELGEWYQKGILLRPLLAALA